jgi:hypothetical protein
LHAARQAVRGADQIASVGAARIAWRDARDVEACLRRQPVAGKRRVLRFTVLQLAVAVSVRADLQPLATCSAIGAGGLG